MKYHLLLLAAILAAAFSPPARAADPDPYNIRIIQRGADGEPEVIDIDGSQNVGKVLGFSGLGMLGAVTPAVPVTDGDKGQITVSAGGTVWTVDPLTITNAMIAAGAGIQFSKLEATPATAASPSLSGVGIMTGVWQDTPYDMPGTVVDVTRSLNRITVSSNTNLTLTGTPAAGRRLLVQITNTGGASVSIGLPAGMQDANSASAVTAVTVAAAAGGNNGVRTIGLQYTGTKWLVFQGGGGAASSVAWADISSKPTTLSGFGLTDAQPLDNDLTLLSAIATTVFGRGLLDDPGSAAFSGDGTYFGGGYYVGPLTGNTTIGLNMVAGDKTFFFFTVSGGPHSFNFPSSRRTATDGGTTSSLTLQNGYQVVGFYYDGTNYWVLPDISQMVAIATDVSGLGGGVATFLATASSANLRAALTDESGDGAALFANGNLGAATATSTSVTDDSARVATTAHVQNVLGKDEQVGDWDSPNTTTPYDLDWDGLLLPIFNNASTGVYNLPPAAGYKKRGVIFHNLAATPGRLDPDASEAWVRDGTQQTGGKYLEISSGTGNYVSFYSDGERWITLGYKGTLSAEP